MSKTKQVPRKVLREQYITEVGSAVLRELDRRTGKVYREYREHLEGAVEWITWPIAVKFEDKIEANGIAIQDVVFSVVDAVVDALAPPPKKKRRK